MSDSTKVTCGQCQHFTRHEDYDDNGSNGLCAVYLSVTKEMPSILALSQYFSRDLGSLPFNDETPRNCNKFVTKDNIVDVGVMHILIQKEYKAGDLPPEGYLAWHEWAEVQHKSGIRTVQCGNCGQWNTPQELSGKTITFKAVNKKNKEVIESSPLCTKCDKAGA